jgi:hydroxymethylbilane synthase
MVITPETALKIVSRGSQLALWQANFVRDELLAVHPRLTIEIAVVKTTGDIILDVPLARIGDRGLFTKELDSALLDGSADLAVHSLKDVPTRLPDGLSIAAVTEREDPRDVLITRAGIPGLLRDLPPGSRVGTSSLRRRAQLRSVRPDLEVLDLRGNLNTRLSRLDSGDYEAILLAAAGVIRMGWRDRISEYLEAADWLPAVGQGALAIVTRTGDSPTEAVLRALSHHATEVCVQAERAFLNSLEGGCQVPIAALASLHGKVLRLDGLVADLDGTQILREQVEGTEEAAVGLGRHLADLLIGRGATEILDEVRRSAGAPPVSPP